MALVSKLEFLFAKRERLMSVAFFAGFIVDNIALDRIDVLWSSLVLFAYLTLAVVAVCLSALSQSKVVRGVVMTRLVSWSPLFAQFALGSLFSGYFIFYTRSASLASSWLFVALLGALFLGNEFFKSYYERFEFQINILFVAIFFFATLYVPILLSRMDAGAFLMSGGVSLIMIVLITTLLSLVAPEVIKRTRYVLAISLGSVFILINALYFTNVIPPVPLSLKEAGVYHLVEKTETGLYQVQTEPAEWFDLAQRYHPKIHHTEGEPLYFYSAVFAPTRLNVPVFHEWQYLDKVKNEWVTTDHLLFQVVGGRDGGYRGYSVKGNIFAGEWRVNVITERGQSLGSTNFTVLDTSAPLVRETKILGES